MPPLGSIRQPARNAPSAPTAPLDQTHKALAGHYGPLPNRNHNNARDVGETTQHRPLVQDRATLYDEQLPEGIQTPGANSNTTTTRVPTPIPRQTALYTSDPFFLHGDLATPYGLNTLFPSPSASESTSTTPHTFPARLTAHRLIPILPSTNYAVLYPATPDPNLVIDGTAVFPRTESETRTLEKLAKTGALQVRTVKMQIWYAEWRVREYVGKAVVWGGSWAELVRWRDGVLRREERERVEVLRGLREGVRGRVEAWLEGVEEGAEGIEAGGEGVEDN